MKVKMMLLQGTCDVLQEMNLETLRIPHAAAFKKIIEMIADEHQVDMMEGDIEILTNNTGIEIQTNLCLHEDIEDDKHRLKCLLKFSIIYVVICTCTLRSWHFIFSFSLVTLDIELSAFGVGEFALSFEEI